MTERVASRNDGTGGFSQRRTEAAFPYVIARRIKELQFVRKIHSTWQSSQLCLKDFSEEFDFIDIRGDCRVAMSIPQNNKIHQASRNDV